MPKRIPRFVIHNAAVIALLVASSVGVYVAITSENQSGINTEHLRDIQQARQESCQHTYEGIRQVFRIFFRPADKRTRKEQRDIRRFNHRIDKLKAGCPAQIR